MWYNITNKYSICILINFWNCMHTLIICLFSAVMAAGWLQISDFRWIPTICVGVCQNGHPINVEGFVWVWLWPQLWKVRSLQHSPLEQNLYQKSSKKRSLLKRYSSEHVNQTSYSKIRLNNEKKHILQALYHNDWKINKFIVLSWNHFYLHLIRCACMDIAQAQLLSAQWSVETDTALVQYINTFSRKLTVAPSRLHPHEIHLSESDLSSERLACLQGKCLLEFLTFMSASILYRRQQQQNLKIKFYW